MKTKDTPSTPFVTFRLTDPNYMIEHGRFSFLEWQEEIHANAQQKGFWEPDEGQTKVSVSEKLALVHSEVSEALEFSRIRGFDAHCSKESLLFIRPDGKPDGFAVELADAVIRLMDLATWFGIDLEYVIALKHSYNLKRPFKHGKLF